jgi:hypothetical protein
VNSIICVIPQQDAHHARRGADRRFHPAKVESPHGDPGVQIPPSPRKNPGQRVILRRTYSAPCLVEAFSASKGPPGDPWGTSSVPPPSPRSCVGAHSGCVIPRLRIAKTVERTAPRTGGVPPIIVDGRRFLLVEQPWRPMESRLRRPHVWFSGLVGGAENWTVSAPEVTRIQTPPKGLMGNVVGSQLRRVDQALFAVAMEAYAHGVSTGRVGDLVNAFRAAPASRSRHQ